MLSANARFGWLFAALLTLGGCAADAAEGEESGSTESDVSATTPAPTTPGAILSVHTTLGIPEDATPTDPVHALIVHKQYVTSYDSQRKNPRWTSWELTPSWIGSAQRSNNFVADRDLTSGIPQPINSDFTSSGFQRGHICPSADRTKSDTDNQATFVFTNVVPQTAESNTGVWSSLERDERVFAQQSHVFIIAGSIYAGTPRTIGNGVTVPSSMFKVVVLASGAHPTPSDITASTRVIAVEIPNTTTVSGSYTRYKTTLASLEAKTGFHFLSDVEKGVHDALASEVDSL